MLTASLRALQRAAALQGAPASAAASGIASTLPGLAAALQRLTLQQPSWAAAQAGGQRSFAAAAAAGGGSGGEVGGSHQQQEQQGAAQLRSESGQLTFADADEALEAWGQAMDQGALQSCLAHLARELACAAGATRGLHLWPRQLRSGSGWLAGTTRNALRLAACTAALPAQAAIFAWLCAQVPCVNACVFCVPQATGPRHGTFSRACCRCAAASWWWWWWSAAAAAAASAAGRCCCWVVDAEPTCCPRLMTCRRAVTS